MGDKILQVADGFWNIRGSFRIGGVLDVGTQASLVKRENGRFVFLDCYSLSESLQRQVDDITGGRDNVEAIINLHPFHTLHVRAAHQRYPQAHLYGTARHVERDPDLPWDPLRTENKAVHTRFSGDFEFSIPAGVDFISANENVHFSSVIAMHRASRTIHVDDTFMYIRLPLPLRVLGMADRTSFHPTLNRALQRRAGAADDFQGWAETVIEQWRDAQNLCAAHTAALLAGDNRGKSIHDRLRRALVKAQKILRSHQRRYG